MKDIISKAFKFIAASLAVLVTAYGVGWTGATTLYTLFKTDKAESTSYVKDAIHESESKIMGIHNADVNGLRDSVGIIVKQNEEIMKQNTEILKRVR